MNDLSMYIAELVDLGFEVSAKYEKMEAAGKAFTAALQGGGKGDFSDLGVIVGETTRNYNEARGNVVEQLRGYRKVFRNETFKARSRGVNFPEHAGEGLLSKEPADYTAAKLIEAITQVKNGFEDLIAAIKTFEQQQSMIRDLIDQLDIEIERLEQLDALTPADSAERTRLKDGVLELKIPRGQLLTETEIFLDQCRNRAEIALKEKIAETFAELNIVLAQLEVLQSKSKDEVQISAKLTEALNENELTGPLLQELHEFLVRCQRHYREIMDQLTARNEHLVQEAEFALAKMHPEMPEAIVLRDLLSQKNTLTENELVSYLDDLELHIAKGMHAGLNALKSYKAKTAEEEGYLFQEALEVDLIGTAILAVADQPEQYAGELWSTGEDIMLRIMLAGFNAQSFFERFGFPTIEAALRSSLERNEFVQALSIFDSDFLPPSGTSREERISILISNSAIQRIFEEALTREALRLDPEKFGELSETHYRSMLNLLDFAELLSIPIDVNLQWAALLHSVWPVGSEELLKASYCLLYALLGSGQSVCLFYSLKALGIDSPDIWKDATFRPMLRDLIERALSLDSEGRNFLIDLCKCPEVAQLAEGDFDSEFLLAALSQYVAIHWGQTTLLNEAWAVWDRIENQYPVLADVLRRQLQGEEFISANEKDEKSLWNEYNNLINQITDRTKMSRYQGVRLAALIHNWYTENYFQGWLRRLQPRRLTKDQIEYLLSEVVVLQQIDDFVENCPLQRNPPVTDAQMEPIIGRIKDNVNNRVTEILELFQRAIKIRLKFILQRKAQAIPADTMEEELHQICSRSVTALWAVKNLLEPELPVLKDFVKNN